MISVDGLRKRYGRHQALDGVTFTVPKGEIFGFVGPNGAGKTSTIRILATLAAPDSGSATIGGVPVADAPGAVRELVGYMPDFFGVYDRLTASEYLEFYAACHGVPRLRRRRVALELLELVDLGDRREAQVDTLSRGMKQRLCLARALVHDPRVLLLDEPASGLDPRARVEMRELVRELRRMGKTILISSHILPELEELCTWVGFIDRGRMVAVGRMEDVRDRVSSGRRIRVDISPRTGQELEPALREAETLLAEQPGASSVEVIGDHVELTVDESLEESDLLAVMIGSGIRVRAFAPVEGDLADAFMRLTAPTGDSR